MKTIRSAWATLTIVTAWATIIVGVLFALGLIAGGVAVAVKGSLPLGALAGVLLISFGVRILEVFRRMFVAEPVRQEVQNG